MNDDLARDHSVDPNALQYQEVLFSIVMTLVAGLSRGNPLVRYPDVLWLFAAMLTFNLAYHRLLKTRERPLVPLFSMSVNVVLCSLILALSGGDQSSFWPLFLLPIFTACLHLRARHVLGACAAAGAFLTCFYVEAFWEGQAWAGCALAIKWGVLALSAAVTAQLSFKERAQRLELARSRARVETLARSLERRSSAELLDLKRQSVGALVPALAHALNNPLAVIVGSVELLLREAPAGSVRREDLERIAAAAERCREVGEDLRAYAQAPRGEAACAS